MTQSIATKFWRFLLKLTPLRSIGLKLLFDTSQPPNSKKANLNPDHWQPISMSRRTGAQQIIHVNGYRFSPPNIKTSHQLFYILGSKNHIDYVVATDRIEAICTDLGCQGFVLNHRVTSNDLSHPDYHNIQSLNDLIEDNLHWLKTIQKTSPCDHWIIMGHSFGGLIASHVYQSAKSWAESESIQLKVVLSQSLSSFFQALWSTISLWIDRLPSATLGNYIKPSLKPALKEWIQQGGFYLDLPENIWEDPNLLITGLVNDDTLYDTCNTLVIAKNMGNQPCTVVELTPIKQNDLLLASTHCATPRQLRSQYHPTLNELQVLSYFIHKPNSPFRNHHLNTPRQSKPI